MTMTYSINKTHPAYIYAADVLNGKYITCEKEKLACQRHLSDLEKQGSPDFPYVFDESRAERIYHYFEICKMDKGVFADEYIKLLAHQYFDLGVLYGWVHKNTGKRRFIRGFKFVARGNAKSTEASCCGLYGLTSDCMYPPGNTKLKKWEMNPFIECMAVDRNQAGIVRDAAMNIARISPEVLRRVEVKKTFIRGKARGGEMRVLSKEIKNKDGGSPTLVVVDEESAHPDSKRIDTVFGGFGKRMQSLMLAITTAGSNTQNNPGLNDYIYSSDILSEKIQDDTFFVIIRELDKDDNPHDESIWSKANPMLHYDNEYSVGLREQIKREHDLAYNSKDGNRIFEFLVKRMNLWQVESKQKFLDDHALEILDELIIPPEEFEKQIKNRDTISGLDASKKVDLTAVSFVYNLPDGKVGIDAKGFIPEAAIEKHEQTDKVPYRYWVDMGWVKKIEGEVIDTVEIGDYICEYEKQNLLNVKEITYDPAYCYQFAVDMDKGRNSYNKAFKMVEIPQTFAQLNEPTEMLMHLILERKLVWNGNPALRWCLANAYLMTDSGERHRLNKKTKDDSQRIDLASAVICALCRFSELKSETLKNKIEKGTFRF